ncbi:hypothetical protein Ddye_005714 [Dipteronia dyeriana]|uniref:Uncharacterized protein n=1 Tax=Dipteronia dyeriana TaxID=168575 RepID=A0AAD9XHA2_9ROSI|nr:hypothetical protein Ddye_005714 [Dipteronia dyeriana]
MKNLRSVDDEFNITFMLFVIGTVLCPQCGIYVSSSYLHVLKNVTIIHTMDWASWCFKLLINGIKQFKSLGHGGVTGCVLFLQLSSHCNNVVKIDGDDNSKFNVGNKVDIHPAMKIMMNNVQNILHIVTNMDERLKLVETSLNEIMKTNSEDAVNMSTKKARVDDGGLIVEEVNHNFIDVSSKDDKSISKANKKMKSFSPNMTANS